VGPEDRVGICVERSLDMVAAVLGVLKAGGAYVPLDPSHPRERLAYVLLDAGAAVLLTRESVLERLPGLADGAGRILCIDRDGEAIARGSSANPDLPSSADRLAYVIYTSGSTGQPKGVQVPHRALVNFLASMRRQPGLAGDDAVLAVTTLSFDIAALELFLPLLAGARVIVAPAETLGDGAALARLLKDSGATVLQATPATWRLLLESGWEGDPGLRLLCGGEALPRELAERLLDKGASLWNLYGPTETTVWSAVDRVRRGAGPVPLGRPIANTRLHLLDRAGQPVPAGVPGELLIGGAGVTRGYLGQPALTAERYLPDPFSPEPGARLYRTGDLVRRRADGALEFLGRADFQVKIRGFRIELGEIEETLARCPAVRQAVVAAREDASGDRRLVAYVVPRGENGGDPVESFDPAVLRSFLRERLPESMAPSVWVPLAELPLTPNGKVDRKALPAPDASRAGRAAGRVAPRTAAERAVAEVWSEVLRLEGIGAHDNFFELGGHSLLLVQVQRRLRQRFARELSVVDLFKHPTVEALAVHLEGARASRGQAQAPSVLVELQPGGTASPLFLVHPLSGELLLYQHVIQALGPGQPVYGFQARGLEEGEEPLGTVEEMAALYVDALLSVRPEGPYLLAGSSLGGLIAYEMARALRSLGREVALLALLDAPAPGRAAAPADGDQGGEAEMVILRSVTRGAPALSLEQLRELAPDERLELILERGREAGVLAPAFGLSELRGLVRVVEANRRALRAYDPKSYDGSLTFVQAAESEKGDATWAHLVRGGIEAHEVPGSHHSMHAPPHAAELAECLQSCIQRALEEGEDDGLAAIPVPEAAEDVAVGELGLES
jgi:amino acid adenylation domain-containing protein